MGKEKAHPGLAPRNYPKTTIAKKIQFSHILIDISIIDKSYI
jgi:hypothetical protein